MSGRTVSFEDLDRIFRPGAVAVVGVSAREMNVNRFFLHALREMGFRGSLYAVNARGEPVDDLPAYSRVSEIPGPVDHVIVAVPASSVRGVLEDIARKGVRSVAIFTSGFAESGQPQGKAMEEEMRGWVRRQSFRIIGPNCMGIYCPESGMAFRPDFPREAGTIGYVSQSGGMTISGVLLGGARGLRFSKAVSYGNEVDLSSVELLEYLARDPRTTLVWLYIEGTRHGPELLAAMERVTEGKPLLVLKGGITASGNRAAASHTGSMAGTSEIWEGSFRKAGAMAVQDLEELVDTTQALQWLPPSRGRRLCLVCISGGLSVNYSDLAVAAGFQVPSLSPRLVADLRGLVDLPGTSVNNPLDLAAGFFRFPAYPDIFRTLDRSEEIDAVMLVLALEYFYIPEIRYPGISRTLIQAFLESGRGMDRPFAVVMPHSSWADMRQDVERTFLEARIPVFPNMRRALGGLDLWDRHWETRRSRGYPLTPPPSGRAEDCSSRHPR